MRLSIAILCVLLLAACAPQQQTPRAPELPAAPEAPGEEPGQTAPPQTPEETTEVTSGLDKAFGPRDTEQVITVDDIVCDPEERTLTFRFRNLDTKSWQLNQDVSFPAPADLDAVRITLNSYEVNGKREVLYQGETMFGPETPFNKNCNVNAVLAPGDEAECTVSPVPLKASSGFGYGANELRINGPGADGIVRFTCG